MLKISSNSIRLLSGFGFSFGAAELALTNPPPLVPSSLMTSCDAIGPPVIDCVVPSSDVTARYALKFCGTPCHTRKRPMTIEIGSST